MRYSKITLHLKSGSQYSIHASLKHKGGIPALQDTDFRFNEDNEFSLGYYSENEATTKHLKAINMIKTINVISQNNPHAAWIGFLSAVEENESFITSSSGIYILYVLLTKQSEDKLVIENKHLKPILQKFFQFKQANLMRTFEPKDEKSIELFATYQIVLQRLGIYRDEKLTEELKAMQIDGSQLDTVLKFLNLREKTKSGLFRSLQDDYFSCLSNMEDLKKFFHESEIVYVISNYFDICNWTNEDINYEKGNYMVNAFNGRKLEKGKDEVHFLHIPMEYSNEFLQSLRQNENLNKD